jgi:hypothetical protein
VSIPPKTPPVYKPNLQRVNAPPVYRPQTQAAERVSQAKQSKCSNLENRPAPPPYRTQTVKQLAHPKQLNAFKLEREPSTTNSLGRSGNQTGPDELLFVHLAGYRQPGDLADWRQSEEYHWYLEEVLTFGHGGPIPADRSSF